MKLVNSKYYNRTDSIMGGKVTLDELAGVLKVVGDIMATNNIHLEQPIEHCLLGSSGKAQTSGDVDIGVISFPDTLVDDRVLKVSCVGTVMSFVIEIPNYSSIDNNVNRNGLVQVDLIRGHLPWLKQFFFSSNLSKFKGAHRNLLISSYLMMFRRVYFGEDTELWTSSSGPIFSQVHGLSERHRTRQRNKAGSLLKTKFIDTYSNQSFNLLESSEVYFKGIQHNAFDSFE